ncbi:hypothetical protein [Tatumella sp. UCD-D_suzukii]|uniref:hypothetical protein n=1 Tax=Tatumella sp. UCD-D_suzukii TaxID=1408192 RepID=UPI00046FBED2|nr:hypothetical protein [Tatumella sp. UCD-D_suzukii]
MKAPRSGGQACRKAGSAEGAAMRPLPGRLRWITGSMPDNKANGIFTVLIKKLQMNRTLTNLRQKSPGVLRATNPLTYRDIAPLSE